MSPHLGDREAMSTNRRAIARSFTHAKCDVKRTLASRFPFAAAVELTTCAHEAAEVEHVEAGTRIMRDLRAAMGRTRYYECAMSIADVLDPHFVHAHVKRGHEEEEMKKVGDGTATRETTAFAATTTTAASRSVSTTVVSIDSDDVWCVTTQGRFVGSFMRDTAEAFGLQTTRDGRGKRLASINLRRTKFKLSNRFHDRIGACARMLEDARGKSSVRCAFSVNDEYVDVKFPPGVDVGAAKTRENVETTREWNACANDADEALLRSIEPPSRDETSSTDVDDLERVLEWIGRISLGFTPDADGCEEKVHRVRSSRWQGFILHPELERVVEHARQLVDSDSTPWAIVTVWAYRDVPSNLTGAPVAKTLREPCRPRGCDAYVIVVFPNDRYVAFSP